MSQHNGNDMSPNGENQVGTATQDFSINRELSWLAFARRVLELAEDKKQPLLERLKFSGIMGMIYDEFVMKRLGGLHRKIHNNPQKINRQGLTPREELGLCWQELQSQVAILSELLEGDIIPALAEQGILLRSYSSLNNEETTFLQHYFESSVLPILTPLAADIGHPFPFISNLSLNVGIVITGPEGRSRFVRLKVPANRKRWVELPARGGYVPLEDVIANNLSLIFPSAVSFETYFFRVTRGAKDDPWQRTSFDEQQADALEPGSIIGMVTAELNYRKFAGIVRLELSREVPADLIIWLMEQLGISREQVMVMNGLLGCADLLDLKIEGREELRDPPHTPCHHPRLARLHGQDCDGFFGEIKKKDILIHLPYHNFDTSILRFIQHAADDPKVLAIKLTIYRTGSKSPIIRALMDAAGRGKQVAVLVEITARFDEEPNIEWGKQLERVGAHVVYGVERLKTHIKLAMIVREENDGIKRYVHVGTGNYHPGTARLYGDLGIISANQRLGEDVARLFNELTGAIPVQEYNELLVAPHNMRDRFTALIRQEAANFKAGKPAGIRAKFNQLQDRKIIEELYGASRVGVPISLNIRGLCCLQVGVENCSESIRVYSILGRFLEHSRIYRFENGGDPIYLIGSADWMKRNLDRRMESIVTVTDPEIQAELEEILCAYEKDNTHSWEMQPDGSYVRLQPGPSETPFSAQAHFAGNSL